MDYAENNTIEAVNPSDKKKRGRKKNSVIAMANSIVNAGASAGTKEKKPRKKRTKKGEYSSNSIVETDIGIGIDIAINVNEVAPVIKKRKRRTRKDIESSQSGDTNTIVSSTSNANADAHTNTNDNKTINNSEHNTDSQIDEPKEEKVAKKRGRKPKGGKITIQPQTNSHIQNELPNIILHLKCSLSDLNNNNIEVTETFDTINNGGVCNSNNNTNSSSNGTSNNNNNSNDNMETIQSYNSINAIGSEINNNIAHDNSDNCGNSTNTSLYHRDLLKNNVRNSQPTTNVHNMITKDDSHSHTKDSTLSETYSSAMFQVYDPCIAVDTHPHPHLHPHPHPESCNTPYYGNSNEIINKNPASIFSTIYSPDIISYNHTFGSNMPTPTHDDEYTNAANLNERDIWKKINQLKLSFHKSDICQNIRGTQRSACFWCTCEFDSPAIYIPKSVLKDMYNVYGCFCSPECGAAFLMNESIDTSTKFERYHLLNSLYGKIYKHEKSIKIAPNPYYLLNKFYGNLTIQEYRKLFQSDQMIYVVNKPLTHILPELYEDNNDFLLNNKIIPTNSVNLKKKVLKSNL